MANINSVAQTNVERVTASVQSQDFSIPALAAYFATSIFSGRSKIYTTATAFETDFPASGATRGINKAGLAFFAQNPRPLTLKVLRLGLPSTKIVTVTPTAANLKHFKLKVNGTEVDYTSDANGSEQEIVEGLKALIDALSVSGLTVTENNTVLTLTGSAGTYFSVEITSTRDDGQMAIMETTTDPGIATDLAAIQVADKNWFAFTLLDGSEAIIDAASSWAESNAKFFVPQTQDSDVITSSTSDVLSTLKTGTRDNTLCCYHHAPEQFMPMRLLGKVLAVTPGKRAFYHKALAGLSVSDLDDTQIGYLEAKYGTYYVEYGGLNRTDGGKVSGNEWGDIIIGCAYYDSRIETKQATTILTDPDKLDGDEGGIAKLQCDLQSVVDEMVTNKFARLDFDEEDGWPDLGYGLTVPNPDDDIDPSTRALTGLAATVKVNGGIKKVTTTLRLVAA